MCIHGVCEYVLARMWRVNASVGQRAAFGVLLDRSTSDIKVESLP